MKAVSRLPLLAGAGLIALGGLVAGAAAQDAAGMTFFVTSAGLGKGGDLGGLAGADRHCQSLAQAAGAGGKTWHAYLSTAPMDGQPGVDARSRIGNGPWQNAKGVVIAKSLDELHGTNNITKQTALTEKGAVVNGRGDTPNMHDILTGSGPDGRLAPGDKNMTCANWTSSGAGNAMLGHADRTGLDDTPAARSWNASHPSRDCSQPGLVATGGAGLLYCFATN
jgi:hypothetical protein